jgi:hypothetical protein
MPKNIKKEKLDDEDDMSWQIANLILEEKQRGSNITESTKAPSLDYYDNRREKGANYRGKYGIFNDFN